MAKRKFPGLLLKLGPAPVKVIEKLRLYVETCRGYQLGARSLRKAYLLSCNPDEVSWEHFRESAEQAEMLFRHYFGDTIDLFEKLGEGMPWIGLTGHGQQALKLTEDFISWYDTSLLMSSAVCGTHEKL